MIVFDIVLILQGLAFKVALPPVLKGPYWQDCENKCYTYGKVSHVYRIKGNYLSRLQFFIITTVKKLIHLMDEKCEEQ